MEDEEYWKVILFRTFRAAKNGDVGAAHFLVSMALFRLERKKLLSPGLGRYLASVARDSKRFSEILNYKKPKKRHKGRPSIDSGEIDIDFGFKYATEFRTYSSRERHALAMAYLISLGHPINAASSGEKESAAVILSELTGRSERSLQSDYYDHRDSLAKEVDFPSRGAIELSRFKALHSAKGGM